MKAASNSDVRLNNRRILMKLLFTEGEMSKQDISHKLNLSLSTVNYLVRELMENQYLEPGKQLGSTGGRKPICIKPIYNARYSIGAEAASDVIRIVALDLGANIIAKESYPVPYKNNSDYWTKIGELIRNFGVKYHIPQEKLMDIGIALGITMQDDKVSVRKKKNQEYMFNIEQANECIQMPVHFRHGTKMAAIAQYRHCPSDKNFIYIYLGAKISAAIVNNGKVMDFSGINGEVGCMLTLNTEHSVRFDSIFSRKDLCSRANCDSLAHFFNKLEEKDPACTDLWDKYLEQLIHFLHNIFCIFGWPIVLGGSVSPYLVNDLPYLEKMVHTYYPFKECPKKILSISVLSEYGAAVGAALFSVNHFLDSQV